MSRKPKKKIRASFYTNFLFAVSFRLFVFFFFFFRGDRGMLVLFSRAAHFSPLFQWNFQILRNIERRDKQMKFLYSVFYTKLLARLVTCVNEQDFEADFFSLFFVVSILAFIVERLWSRQNIKSLIKFLAKYFILTRNWNSAKSNLKIRVGEIIGQKPHVSFRAKINFNDVFSVYFFSLVIDKRKQRRKSALTDNLSVNKTKNKSFVFHCRALDFVCVLLNGM